MDFSLSEEQKMVQDMARRFSDQELKPIAAQIDQDHKHNDNVLKKMAENGFMGVAIPSEYGGAGMDYMAYALILTEISRGCASTRRDHVSEQLALWLPGLYLRHRGTAQEVQHPRGLRGCTWAAMDSPRPMRVQTRQA